MTAIPRARPIEGVYLLTHKYYLRLTRICVASIRFWYPDVPIYLIKDKIAGDFSTEEIERAWNVRVYETSVDKFGWGFAHIEPLLDTGGRRVLIIDVDIVFMGRVLDFLAGFTEDLIVHKEDHPPHPTGRFDGLYFSLEKLKALDPDFRFPGYAFNAGQIVATTGVIQREDFGHLINWGSPRTTSIPEVFNRGDQGVLNYVVMKKHAAGELSLARVPFMVWNPKEMETFDLAKVDANSPYPLLIHWAGLRRPKMRDMPRSDILFMFEDLYYSRIPLARVRLAGRLTLQRVANFGRKVQARLTGKHPNLYLT